MMASHPDCEKQTRVFLWCSPRTISTCFLKCLSFVDGVQAWHEPYQIPHNVEANRLLSESNPGEDTTTLLTAYADAAMTAREKSNEFSGGRLMPVEKFTYPWIKSRLEAEEPDKKYIFVKDSAFAICKNPEWLPDAPTRHTFIIRHPYLTMTSWRKMIMGMMSYEEDPSTFTLMPDVADQFYGKNYVYCLWKYVIESGKDPNPIIIAAEDLIDYPEKTLKKYLEALGIPYRESYVTWDESEESIKNWRGGREWFVMGKQMGLFDKAFRSSCFLPKTRVMPDREDLTPDITGIVDRLLPGYEEMYQRRLKPE